MSGPIDRERLAEAIACYDDYASDQVEGDCRQKHSAIVVAAARAHLATLPEKPKVTLVEMVLILERWHDETQSIHVALRATLKEAVLVMRAVEEFRKEYWGGDVGQAGYDLYAKLPKP